MLPCLPTRTTGRAVAVVFILLLPGAARADWFIIPAVGLTFASDTNLLDFELAAGRATKVSFQGSALWLGEGWFGLEAEASYTADFFGREEQRLVTRSAVSTAMGGIVVAAPLAWTKTSLRPYGVACFGLIRATATDIFDANPLEANLTGWRFGGGALGFFTDTVGVRWELSHIRTLKGQGNPEGVAFGSRSLKFWRASMGLVLRF